MSSDLWAAFGRSEDLAANPWAQSSSQSEEISEPSDTQKTEQKTAQLPAPSFSWEQPQSELSSEPPLQVPWDESIDLNHAIKLEPVADHDNDPWSVFDGQKKNAWSGTASTGSRTEPWPSKLELIGSSTAVGSLYEEIHDEDDFGEFEEPEQELLSSAKVLSIDEPSHSTSKSASRTNDATPLAGERSGRPQHRRSQSVQQYDPYADLDLLSKPKSTTINIKRIDSIQVPDYKPQRPNHSTTLVEELTPYSTDEWAWSELSPDPVATPHFTQETTKSTKPPDKQSQQVVQHARSRSEPPKKARSESKAAKARKESTTTPLPPTNVPPPSILMSLVAGLVQKLPLQVEAVMENPAVSTSSQKALEKALRQCIASLRVAARITAGRKVRWKRDTHLSQSMKIGPAGKQGGMKLTGVDKSELRREEREAAEFVRIWQQKLGSIRSALATVNGQIAGRPLTLPDISGSMTIKSLKPVDGGILAPKCCMLCGLKRDERVEKVDVDVWDSFGEFWADHWGHSECRLFWEEHERYLQKR